MLRGLSQGKNVGENSGLLGCYVM